MKKILICTNSFYPSYKSGGPVRSLTNLVDLISDSHNIDVYTKDRDLGSTSSFEGINVNSWNNKYRKASVFYSNGDSSIYDLTRKVLHKKYDTIYLNGFFDFRFSILIYILVFLGFVKCNEIILAPRGELTQGAMYIKSIKKKLFLNVFLLLGFHKKITFHLTANEEFDEFKKFIKTSKTIICPNMHEKIPEYFRKNKKVNEIKVVFLSRISKKKNLEYAIESFSKINIPSHASVIFDIVGNVEDPVYFKKCEKITQNINNVTFNFHGSASRKEVKKYFENSHLFFLPTLNENYGHAIVEAMVNSNLILISNNTPWNEVNNHGSFVSTLDDVDKFARNIEKVLFMDEDEFNHSTKQTYKFIKKSLSNNENEINKLFG